MTTFTDSITDEQIEALSTEAAQHGDHATVVACQVALGEWDGEFGGRDNDPAVQGASRMTPVEARATCAEIIADAAAMLDGD